MLRLAFACLALAPLAASADADPKFAKLRDSSQPLSGLGSFLERYVGECGDLMSSAECKGNAATFRREANGKRFYMIITEDAATMISPGNYDPRHEQLTLNITPFFPANSYALTLGAPKKTDAEGNPVLPLLYVKAKIPEGLNAGSMARLIGTRGIRLQVIFSPQEVWSLPKKGGRKIYGVRARIDAMLVTVGRTGEELALWP